jgi:hypothetical protein
MPAESLETKCIYSAMGHLELNQPLLSTRQFLPPHHPISDAGMDANGSISGPSSTESTSASKCPPCHSLDRKLCAR